LALIGGARAEPIKANGKAFGGDKLIVSGASGQLIGRFSDALFYVRLKAQCYKAFLFHCNLIIDN